MTKEQAIELIKEYKVAKVEFPNDLQEQALDMAIKALEQQPSEDKITITMDKGTLKYSGQGYVAYKKDWFRKHFATEVEIMTYFDGYRKEQEKTKSSVPLSEIYRVIAGHSDYHGDNILAALTCIAEGKEVDTVKPLSQPTSEDCVSRQAVDLLCFRYLKPNNDDNVAFYEHFCDLQSVTPAIPTSDDCVSRQALINSYNGIETPVGYRKVVDMQVIEDLPPVTPTFPKGATNGDMIRIMFPRIEIYTDVINEIVDVEICEDSSELRCSVDWWNAPYK